MLIQLPRPVRRKFYAYFRKQYAHEGVALEVLNYLSKCDPDFKPRKMDGAYAFSKIFSGAPYQRKKLLNSLSDLHHFLADFLLQQYLTEHQSEKDLLKLQAYKFYGLNEQYFLLHRNVESKLEAAEVKDLWTPLALMHLSHDHYHYPDTERVSAKEVKIQPTVEYLDEFYTLAKLKAICELYNRRNTLGEELVYRDDQEEERLLVYKTTIPVCRCYQYALQMIRDRAGESAEQLRQMLFDQQAHFTQLDKQILISYLVNHQAYLARQGEAKGTEILKLYRAGIEDRFFITGGFFEDTHFINIVDVARSIGENDWAEQFITDWKDQLESRRRDAVITITTALIEFSRKSYHAVIRRLNQFKVNHIHYEMRSRGLLIAAHFESDDRDDDTILRLCSVYDQFIRRNMPLQSKREGVWLYTRVVRKLLEPQPDKEKLRDELKKAKRFLYRNWLAQKIEAL